MKFDLECKKHPEYQAKAYPWSGCGACLTLYWLTKDGARYICRDTETKEFAALVVVKTRKKHVTPLAR
jgi:hypothetical protein